MIANAADLRELADALELFPGIKAREWTPGENWCLTFTASMNLWGGHINALVEVLNVLLQASGVKGETVPVQDLGPDVGPRYRISGDGGESVTKLTANLRGTHKELWRRR